jgi:phage/plasmid-like protein (TIGR03299 family)
MPAYFDCGFSVREPMWHGEGTVLEDYPEDWDDARLKAGLLWEPKPVSVFTERMLTREQIVAMTAELGSANVVVPEELGGQPASPGREDRKFQVFVKVPDHQAVARDDNDEVLSVPSGDYSVITHGHMGQILDAVLDADSNIKFETAGSCNGGRQVWALAYLDEPYTVPGDTSPTFPFLAMLNSHDRSTSCSLTYTDVRVVCWNTWNAAAAQGERSGARFTFRHTGNIDERIAEAKTALAELRKDSEETRKLFEQLAQQPVDGTQVKTFTELFLPSPRDVGEQCSDRVHQNVLTARTTFDRLYSQSETNAELPPSAYRLLMASTEYLDHIRKFQSRDTYLGRTLLKPEGLKVRALGLIDEVLASA